MCSFGRKMIKLFMKWVLEGCYYLSIFMFQYVKVDEDTEDVEKSEEGEIL